MRLKFYLLWMALVPMLLLAAPRTAKQASGKREVTEPTRFEYRMALQAIKNGDMQMGWDYLRQDHYLNPQSGWPVAEMATFMYYAQQVGNSMDLAEEALKLLPKRCARSNDMYCLLAYGHLSRRDTAKAIRAFQAAIKACPDSLAPYFGLADIYNYHDEFRKEEQLINSLKRLAPQNPIVYLYGCRNYEMQGKPILAIKDGKRALALDSTDAQIHSFLATPYFDTDCPSLACQEVVAALADPELRRASRQFFTYGMVYEEEMEHAIRSAMARDTTRHDYYASQFADLEITIAMYFAESDSARLDTVQKLILQHRQKSLDYYLLIHQPTDFDYYNMACLYALRGEQELAILHLRRAVEAGYDNKEWAMKDEDLISLHLLPEYLDLLQQMEQNHQSKIINK